MITDYAPSLEHLRFAAPRRLRRSLAIGAAAAGLAVVGLGSVAHGGVRGSATVVVRNGDSLWSIASNNYPGDDVPSRINDIIVENHLAGAAVHAGETLTLPAA